MPDAEGWDIGAGPVMAIPYRAATAISRSTPSWLGDALASSKNSSTPAGANTTSRRASLDSTA